MEEQRLTRQLFPGIDREGSGQPGDPSPHPTAGTLRYHRCGAGKVVAVIDRFRKPGRTFLMPPIDRELEGGTIIDISHESLMRVWVSLGRWVDDEAVSPNLSATG